MNVAAGGLVLFLLLIGFLILLVMLFVAPLKLYGIHREILRTNDLLKYQNDLLKYQSELLAQLIADQARAQAGLVAALSWDKKGAGSSASATSEK